MASTRPTPAAHLPSPKQSAASSAHAFSSSSGTIQPQGHHHQQQHHHHQPLRPALKSDDDDLGSRTPPASGSIKAVQIHEPESGGSSANSPHPSAAYADDEQPASLPKRQFTASVGLARRLSGRAALNSSVSSLTSLVSTEPSPSLNPDDSAAAAATNTTAGSSQQPTSSSASPYDGPLRGRRYYHHKLLAQVSEWLEHEKKKLEARSSKRSAAIRTSSRRRKSASPPGAGPSAKSDEHSNDKGGVPEVVEPDGAPVDSGPAAAAAAVAAAYSGPEPSGKPDEHRARHHNHHPRSHPRPRSRPRSDSVDSNSSGISFDRLQRILEDSLTVMGMSSASDLSLSPKALMARGRSSHSHRKKLVSKLHRTQSSDTEYHDGDVIVPRCDAVLDNSRTLSLGGPGGSGSGGSSTTENLSRKERKKVQQAWSTFKNEIIRLSHTLRLKGWRRVPLDGGDSVAVKRLSGALTNAVYLVSPPEEDGYGSAGKGGGTAAAAEQRKKPPKLLLRIYGPNVEALIDREHELNVLRRLARKKIGPRLLGTFQNGRFEQYFNSTTLTPANLREPEMSRQIAKRMRELHEGISLLPEERAGGAALWKNWERWLHTVETRIKFLDEKVRRERANGHGGQDPGFVCGVEWEKFKEVLERYRNYVDDAYRSPAGLRDRLVFAHNDTQYGNILRVRPDDETSPLLQPENEHKQLVVIDFEYAAPNTRGFEFANHFTEWTYNYHDAVAPHRCNTRLYPTPEQQRRFIRAYVEHRPKPSDASGDATPRMAPVSEHETAAGVAPSPGLRPIGGGNPSASSIVEFMLDARVPPGGWREAEQQREEAVERKVEDLMKETRLWRAGCSAQWVAWGIVQAKIPGAGTMTGEVGGKENEKEKGKGKEMERGRSGSLEGNSSEEGETGSGGGDASQQPEAEQKEEEFDYLAYAQERAMFFWGDCVVMGLVKKEELGEDVCERLKIVDH